jgi:hypothetical protein
VRLFFGVCATMHEHFVSGIKATIAAQTSLPFAVIQVVRRYRTVHYRNVICQTLESVENSKLNKNFKVEIKDLISLATTTHL